MIRTRFSVAASALLFLILNDNSALAQRQGGLVYPQTKKGNVSDNYHGTTVADPYRWLENDTAADVKAWVEAENKVTQEYLSRIPYRELIKNRLTELWNYSRQGVPTEAGGKYYFFKNDGLQNQSILYVSSQPQGVKPEVFLDPNKLSADGTVALGNISFSRDGRYMGYAINRSGSDWQEIYVMDTKTKQRTKDSIRWAKFSGIAWKGNGFYYSRYDEPKGESELSSKNSNQKIYFHKIGDPQSSDELVFEDPSRPLIGYGAGTTEDESFLIIYGTEGASSGNEIYVRNLKAGDKETKKLFTTGFANNYSIVDNIGDKLLLMTDYESPRYKLVLVDPKNPDPKNWNEIIPESPKNVMSNVSITGGKIFATYMQDAAMHVYKYSLEGKQGGEISLPGLGTVGGFGGKRDAKTIYYSFTSFTYPSTVFKYDIATDKSTVLVKPDVKFNPADYESKQVFITTSDGTQLPMFIVHKKGLVLNNQNPTYLYGYGGFNISLNPTFTASRLILLENGGIFAMVNLRGGGEYGEEWHKAGMLAQKQNVFNDFIAAAEYLIENGYTNPSRLAIAGGSNGGLLVGATLNQRPDLFAVAFPAVGVMDMLRFHKFTIGYAWVNEYGSSDDEDQFQYLYKYSPVHNIRSANYPAVMVTTADHDDRVVPAHSFKYAATLQEKNTSQNPVLIRIETKAGHGAGKPTSKLIEEWADIWSFMFYNMDVEPVYKK
jgi:prolyl oligopeptidase